MKDNSMDIDKALNKLIFEYKIDRYNPAYRNFVKAQELIEKVYSGLMKNYKEVVVVSDKWADIGYFCDFAGKKCRYLIVENPVLPNFGELSEFDNNECFLVASLEYRDELTTRLSERVGTVLDLYDFFEDEGIYFEQNYYEIYPSGYHNFELNAGTEEYTEFKMGVVFLNHRNRFKEAKTTSHKEKYLGRMIFDCAYNRDFLMLKECVDMYVGLGYGDSENYITFLKEVEALLLKIKWCFLERNKKDVVMYWLDALEYGDDKDVMPFLNSLDETALCMDNMYTVTPSTHPTFRTLFAKRRVIEEQSYNLKRMTKDDSRLIQELEKRGYSFACYGQWVKNEESFRANHYVYKNADFTYVFWTFLKDVMMEPEKKFFAVVHELFNTHYPYFSFGYSDKYFTPANYIPGMPREDYKQKMGRQHDEALEYVDKHLKYYADILPGNVVKLYMSDHGHTYYGRYHVVMKLHQDNITPQRYDDMISLFDFDKFILGILDNNAVDADLLGREYVIVQDSEYRHYKYILDSINSLNISERGLLGYQGIITKDDLLICYREGVTFYPENYYRRFIKNGKIVTDVRIDYLKERMSHNYVDLDSSDEFKYSRMAVNGLKKHFLRIKDEEDRKWQLINKAIANGVNTGITAIRGGGAHTEKLLMLLSGDIREKIDYVIDSNRECAASNLGAKIILPEEVSEYKIDCVIISSFVHHNEWKREFENFSKMHIVDIYEILEKEGILCKREFYFANYTREDFE